MFSAQREEQVGAGGETVIGAVVDDSRQIGGRRQDRLEMRLLGSQRRTARQHARDDHQAVGADLLGMRSMGNRRGAVDGAGADDDRHAGLHQALHALHALCVGQQRPVAHGAAIDDRRHALRDQFLALAHQRIEIGAAVCLARGHQRGDYAGENLGLHVKLLWACRVGADRDAMARLTLSTLNIHVAFYLSTRNRQMVRALCPAARHG